MAYIRYPTSSQTPNNFRFPNWKAGTYYPAGSMVATWDSDAARYEYYSSRVEIPVDHVDPETDQGLAIPKWVPFGGDDDYRLNNWVPHTYDSDDLVSYKGTIYKSLDKHTDSETLTPNNNPDHWTPLETGGGIDRWDSENEYGLEDKVEWNDLLWKSVTTPNLKAIPGTDSDWVLLSNTARIIPPWSSGEDYAAGEIIERQGQLHIALQDTNAEGFHDSDWDQWEPDITKIPKWKPDTDYDSDDMIEHLGNLYIAKQVPGTDAFYDSDWELFQPESKVVPKWKPNTDYDSDDMIEHLGNLYIAKQVPGTENFYDSDWELFQPESKTVAKWKPDTSYDSEDVIEHLGDFYKATQITGTDGFYDSDWEILTPETKVVPKWKPNTDYDSDDMIEHLGDLYIANKVPGTDAFYDSDWDLFQPESKTIPKWKSGTSYDSEDVIEHLGDFYKATQVTGDENFYDSDWEILTPETKVVPKWKPNTDYDSDDMIEHLGNLYIANKVPGTENFYDSDWDLFQPESKTIPKWKPDTSYDSEDVIEHLGDFYKAKQVTGTDNFYDSDWEILTPETKVVPKWKANTSYDSDDMIEHLGNLYIAKQVPGTDAFYDSDWELYKPDSTKLGEWTPETTYDSDDLVVRNGEIYKAKKASETDDFYDSDWELWNPEVNTIPKWKANTSYQPEDMIQHGEKLWLAKTGLDSESITTFDSDNWEAVESDVDLYRLNQWVSEHSYDSDDMVSYGGLIYKAVAKIPARSAESRVDPETNFALYTSDPAANSQYWTLFSSPVSLDNETVVLAADVTGYTLTNAVLNSKSQWAFTAIVNSNGQKYYGTPDVDFEATHDGTAWTITVDKVQSDVNWDPVTNTGNTSYFAPGDTITIFDSVVPVSANVNVTVNNDLNISNVTEYASFTDLFADTSVVDGTIGIVVSNPPALARFSSATGWRVFNGIQDWTAERTDYVMGDWVVRNGAVYYMFSPATNLATEIPGTAVGDSTWRKIYSTIPTWNVSASYLNDDIVYNSNDNHLWKALTNVTGGASPEQNTTSWRQVGPENISLTTVLGSNTFRGRMEFQVMNNLADWMNGVSWNFDHIQWNYLQLYSSERAGATHYSAGDVVFHGTNGTGDFYVALTDFANSDTNPTNNLPENDLVNWRKVYKSTQYVKNPLSLTLTTASSFTGGIALSWNGTDTVNYTSVTIQETTPTGLVNLSWTDNMLSDYENFELEVNGMVVKRSEWQFSEDPLTGSYEEGKRTGTIQVFGSPGGIISNVPYVLCCY